MRGRIEDGSSIVILIAGATFSMTSCGRAVGVYNEDINVA